MAALNKLHMGVWGRIGSNYPINLIMINGGNYTPTKGSLANKFQGGPSNQVPYSVDDIENFNVDSNNNVTCHTKGDIYIKLDQFSGTAITGFYELNSGTLHTINQGAFRGGSLREFYSANLKYYSSAGGFKGFAGLSQLRKMSAPKLQAPVLNYFLENASNLRILRLDSQESLTVQNNSRTTLQGLSSLRRLYIPKVESITDFGPSNINVLPGVKVGCVIYIDPIFNVNPLHSVLDYCVNTRSCVLRFVQNYTKPVEISDLLVSNISNSSVQVNFTPPQSTNSLDFYEVWIEEVGSEDISSKVFPSDIEILSSGETITGLSSNTTYILRLASCDIYYNGSGMSQNPSFSNEVIFTTL